MTDSREEQWKSLMDSEKNSCDEYCGGVALSDWPGYDDAQTQRRKDTWHWLDDRLTQLRDEIAESSNAENHENERYNRRDYIASVVEGNNRKIHRNGPNYPAAHATDNEAVYIEEREYYVAWNSAYEAQKARKTANLNWLQERRKYVWRQAEGEIDSDAGPGWDKKHRSERYDNLCIATHYGSAWDEWCETHDPETGEAYGNQRDEVVKNCRKYLGVSESPPDSNRGDPQPSKWQDRVYGSDGVPWCACFAVCMAWDVGVKGSGTASVWQNTELAKQGSGIYRGYTTDISKVRKGDHAFFGSDHTGVVVEDGARHNIEGNTSPGSEGSQYNGGCVAEKSNRSGITGWGLVRFDD